jgi:hypothetical protein
MIPGRWTELAAGERMAELHAARIWLRRRPPWRGPELLTQRGDRS